MSLSDFFNFFFCLGRWPWKITAPWEKIYRKSILEQEALSEIRLTMFKQTSASHRTCFFLAVSLQITTRKKRVRWLAFVCWNIGRRISLDASCSYIDSRYIFFHGAVIFQGHLPKQKKKLKSSLNDIACWKFCYKLFPRGSKMTISWRFRRFSYLFAPFAKAFFRLRPLL